ncbi:MAG: DUF512 domain-containing protein [Clostridia bacterium]|nr:DUF512 domain-containing protein [Clostridia bacterium]
MAVKICGVEKKSPAAKKRIKAGDTLLKINGNDIVDVLDYRFYQGETELTLTFLRREKEKQVKIKKSEDTELGLIFDSYLMDAQHSCKNKCIFCFIDQLPKGMRDTLYFKDDDSRLSFLFGNYITLTNLTEHEVERIIKMHISPVNISVHTTNPELRCKMMNNRFAGDTLGIIKRFDDAGIRLNFQLVLVPGYNDGEELRRSLKDLSQYKNVECIASVPVGLTRFRDGLTKIEPFNKETAAAVIDITEEIAKENKERFGNRLVYAADEFYLKAERQMPHYLEYGDFPQLDNGVGMWSLFEKEADDALLNIDEPKTNRKISCVTGVAAYPLLKATVDKADLKWHNLECEVYPIKNNFFGDKITVAGLVTGQDIMAQLKDKDLGEELLVPSNMLRFERDLFLDDVSVEELEKALSVKVKITEPDGYSFICSLADI